MEKCHDKAKHYEIDHYNRDYSSASFHFGTSLMVPIVFQCFKTSHIKRLSFLCTPMATNEYKGAIVEVCGRKGSDRYD